MNQRLKILLSGLVLCIMTQSLMLFIDQYVLVRLGDWTMTMDNKYLILNWTILDKNLVRWFPLIIGISCVIFSVKDVHILVKRVFWTLLSVLSFIVIAILIALFTWTNDTADSPLLPEYIKYQPFVNYWTVFISLGILLAIIPIAKSRKEQIRVEEIIEK